MRFTQLLATATAAAALFGAGADSAFAASNRSLIPEGSLGSITVHKFVQPAAYGPDSQGMELPADTTSDFTPLPGATFRIRQLSGVDLATTAGWQKAQAIARDFDPFDPESVASHPGVGLVGARSLVTDDDGRARFSAIPVGLYLVEETGTPPVSANSAVTGSMPFLVTVPLTHPTDLGRWVFDVHVYPKNVVSAVTKAVVDAETVSAGQTIEYTIDSTIPGGAVTTQYSVADHLDSRLSYVSTHVLVGGEPTSDVTVTHVDGLVTVRLGESARKAGLDALRADPNATVRVVHTVTVMAGGEIPNSAILTFQRPGESETRAVSTEVVSKFGGVTVLKHNRDERPLAGATFAIRASRTDSFESSDAVTINGVSSWTTGTDGKLTIDGLRYSAWADGAAAAPASGKHAFYWLVEIAAPSGYELVPEPIPFTVDAQVAQAPVIAILNTEKNAGASLPLTGAEGTASLAAVGAALVIGGGGALAISRRRQARGK